MDDMLFNLRFTSKQLDRLARKAEKEQKAQLTKVKKALTQKNKEGAQIYAENAIRKKNEALNYMRFSARVDAVHSKVQTGMAMKSLTKDIAGISKGLDKAMSSMDLEKVEQIMGKFEKQFEDLDVRTATVEGAMGSAMTLSTPQDQVESLIAEVAEENGLEVMDQLRDLNAPSASMNSASASSSSTAESKKEDELSRRLQALRN